MVARGVVEILPQAQVALGSLDRGMPQRDLDLLERRAYEVGNLGEGAPQVVGDDLSQPGAEPVGDGRTLTHCRTLLALAHH